MPAKRTSDPIQQIDEWYQRRRDGTWEHQFGAEIVSCDNPGSLMRFTDMPLPANRVADLTETLRRTHGAELMIRESTVEVFSRSLRMTLSAAAKLIEISRNQTNE